MIRNFLVGAGLLGVLGFVAVASISQNRPSFDIRFSEVPPQERSASWRFIVLPDLHNAEGYLQTDHILATPQDRATLREEHTALYRSLGDEPAGELVLMPGDTGNGEWHTEAMANALGHALSPAEQVRMAADLIYPQLRGALADAGYSTVLFALGDHEIADNPWRPGTRTR